MTELSEAGMPMVKPDTVTLSTVINSWARSGAEGAAERAEQILNRMEGLGDGGGSHGGGTASSFSLRANRYTYGGVLNAWAQSGDADAPHRALAILVRMEEAYKAGNHDAKPTQPSYNAVINAFAKSSFPSKAVEAESILHMMLDSYNNGNQQAKPSVITYSAIMNACAYTQGDREDRRAAFRIAQSCFKQIVRDGNDDDRCNNNNNNGPNNIVFRTFFIACANLVPPGERRDELVRFVFDECCRRGMLDVKIMVNLRRSFSYDLLSSLCSNANSSSRISNSDHLARGRIELEDLPPEWRSNITLHGRRHIR